VENTQPHPTLKPARKRAGKNTLDVLFTQRFPSFLKRGNYAAHYRVYAERSTDIFVVDVRRDHEKTGVPANLDF